MNKLFLVFSDNASGKVWYTEVEENGDWTYQSVGGAHGTCIAEFDKENEAIQYIEDERIATTKYVVFVSQDMYFWYAKMNNCDGETYQSIGGNYNNVSAEFDKEEDAINYCDKQNRIA